MTNGEPCSRHQTTWALQDPPGARSPPRVRAHGAATLSLPPTAPQPPRAGRCHLPSMPRGVARPGQRDLRPRAAARSRGGSLRAKECEGPYGAGGDGAGRERSERPQAGPTPPHAAPPAGVLTASPRPGWSRALRPAPPRSVPGWRRKRSCSPPL